MPNQKKQQQKRPNSGKKKGKADDSWIDTDRVVNKAQHIVNSAVNVLQEEMAAGILAAKKIEKKLIDVDEIRRDPDALMNRIRRDSHEVLDLIIDGFASISGQLNNAIEALKKETDDQKMKKSNVTKPNTSEIVVLEPEKPLRAGESTKMSLLFYEDEDDTPKPIALRKSDLIGPRNQRINVRALKIEPKVLSLVPKQEKSISITVNLPKNCQPGRYNALLTDVNNPLVRVLLSIEVVE